MYRADFQTRNCARTWIIAALAIVLAGCMVGPDFKRPEVPSVGRYTIADLQHTNIDAGLSLEEAWWRLFESDALNAVTALALEHNRTLEAAAWSLAQAQELANARAGALRPHVNFTTGAGRQKYGAQFLGPLPPQPPFTYFSIGPAISYTLDYTGGLGRSVEQQRALAEYRRHQLAAARLAVTGNAVTQALRIASLNAQIETTEALLERDRENLELVKLAFEAGSVSRLDVVSAESQLASDATQLPPLRQALSVARHALAVIVGATPAESALPDFQLTSIKLPTELPLVIPSELARRRPDILAAEAQLHAATAAVGVATADLYPRIDLTASFTQQSFDLDTLFDRERDAYGLAVGLVAPLFDGGRLRAQKRAAEAALRATAANYEQTVLEAFAQVADSLEALGHDAEELESQLQAEKAAQATVDLTRRSYQEGNVGILQVLDAERRYQQARLGVVRAQAQRYMDTVQLFLALGGGNPAT
jgi:NodT family efflux transporter outer membrane factor (OMF) lipoprotein